MRGIAVAFTLRVLGLTGSFRIFLPYLAISAMEKEASAGTGFRGAPAEIEWAFPITSGYVDLSAEDLARVESQDVLLLDDARPALLFPGNPRRGWRISLLRERNNKQIRIDNYFEEDRVNAGGTGAEQQETQQMPTPDLGQLPVRVQVVVGEKTLTLAEANGLAGGTILELDRGKADAADLAVNGKVIGKGQLVEVEGRLGVKILSWKGA
jgi:type III secretion system YscQ/HrcQ family protein